MKAECGRAGRERAPAGAGTGMCGSRTLADDVEIRRAKVLLRVCRKPWSAPLRRGTGEDDEQDTQALDH